MEEEQDDDEEVVITVQCTFYLKTPASADKLVCACACFLAPWKVDSKEAVRVAPPALSSDSRLRYPDRSIFV